MIRDRQGPLGALYAALAATCFAGWIFKAHCLRNDAWYDLIQYQTGCYSDAVPFWGLRGVSAGQVPYLEAPIEYPVLTGGLIWVEGAITRGLFSEAAGATAFLGVVTLVNAALAFLVFAMLRRFALPRERLWAWALSPLLLIYLGQNWDMLAVALTVGALLLARDGRLAAAGALAGLGVSAKLYPGLLVPILCLQALLGDADRPLSHRLGHAALVGLAALGAYVAVNAPVAALAFENWANFYRFSADRGATAASVWEILGTNGWFNPSHEARNRLAMALVIAGSAAILALGWKRHERHFWVLFTPVLVWFVLVNKVYSPQFDLWLYPVLLLTIRRSLPIVIFAIGSVTAFYTELWWFSGQEGGTFAVGHGAIDWTAALRAAGLLWAIGSGVFSSAPAWVLGHRQAGYELPLTTPHNHRT